VEYSRRSRKGLIQQGWKDSFDSVFHADGSLAEPPIALCEVQGYAYAAKQAAARLASALGLVEKAEALRKQARTLQTQFEEAFWCDSLETYALALDGDKKPCRVRTSNAGHCLFTGIASQRRAALLSKTLLGKDMFSGWGVRTVSAKEERYNPISYHNGSVWPHDNAMIASGLSRYGWPGLATAIFSGLFDASLYVDLQRLPELFCGIHRRSGDGPTAYPVACAPQSWAAAAPFLMLEAFLGISIDGCASKIGFSTPALPDFLEHVRVEHLRVGEEGSVDFLIRREGSEIAVEVLRQESSIDVVIDK
jgi:glycogen debranching enzyme